MNITSDAILSLLPTAEFTIFPDRIEWHKPAICPFTDAELEAAQAALATVKVTTISKLQFIEWCEANNKLTELLSLLDSDGILKFKWDAATALEISNPLVQGAAAALGITDPQAVFNEIGQ